MRGGLEAAVGQASVRLSEVDLEASRLYREAFNDEYRLSHDPEAARLYAQHIVAVTLAYAA